MKKRITGEWQFLALILLSVTWASVLGCPTGGIYLEGYIISGQLVDEEGNPVVAEELEIALETSEGLFVPFGVGRPFHVFGRVDTTEEFRVWFSTRGGHTSVYTWVFGEAPPTMEIPIPVRVILRIHRNDSVQEIGVDVTQDMFGEDEDGDRPIWIPLDLGIIQVPPAEQ